MVCVRGYNPVEMKVIALTKGHGFGWNGHVFVEKATSAEKTALLIVINFSICECATKRINDGF